MIRYWRVDNDNRKNNVFSVLMLVFLCVVCSHIGGCTLLVAWLLSGNETDSGLTAEGAYRQAVCMVNETDQAISFEIKWGNNAWEKHSIPVGNYYVNYSRATKTFNEVAKIRFNASRYGAPDWKAWTVTPKTIPAGGERQYFFTKRNGSLAFYKY